MMVLLPEPLENILPEHMRPGSGGFAGRHVMLRHDSPLDARQVRECLLETRDILRRNRNRTWARPVGCVTDDLAEAARFLWPRERERLWTRGISDAVSGTTWGHRGEQVIWLRPGTETADWVDTLVHEVAHALTRGSHGYTWRRAFVLLRTVLGDRGLVPAIPDVVDLVRGTVLIYRQRATNRYRASLSHGVAFAEEVDAHLAAVERFRRRVGTL